jgi:hypothetical protein
MKSQANATQTREKERTHTLINNEHLCPQPSRACLFVLPDLLSEVFGALNAEADAGEGMNRNTADVACCYTCEL